MGGTSVYFILKSEGLTHVNNLLEVRLHALIGKNLIIYFSLHSFGPQNLNVSTCGGSSPALLSLQQPPVRGDLSLQPHLGVEQLAVALALVSQAAPHLLQLPLQAGDHLREVVELGGVQLLGVLQGGLQAFLLKTTQTSVLGVRLCFHTKHVRVLKIRMFIADYIFFLMYFSIHLFYSFH